MPILRTIVSWRTESNLPRDRMVITPHFNAPSLVTGPDVQALVDDLADGLQAWHAPSGMRELDVRMYDARVRGTKDAPVPPLAQAVRDAGQAPSDGGPRELALCLSYYNEHPGNKRRRGRLYLPWIIIRGSASADGNRPPNSPQQKVADLVPIFTGLGGVEVDWVIYSRADDEPRPVTNWWVDNEWDVIRKRGLRPTGRLTGSTTEANPP
jgi:hypothetical protein